MEIVDMAEMVDKVDNRRQLLKSLVLVSTVGSLEVWKSPFVKAVVLPVHAITSEPLPEPLLSCSMATENQVPIAEGATVSQNFLLTFSTTPPMPGVDLNWVGRCNGEDDFGVQTNTLDENGELEILVLVLELCDGGPPNDGDVILHSGTLVDVDGDATAECSVVYES